jgi:hypothetical protein
MLGLHEAMQRILLKDSRTTGQGNYRGYADGLKEGSYAVTLGNIEVTRKGRNNYRKMYTARRRLYSYLVRRRLLKPEIRPTLLQSVHLRFLRYILRV